MSKTAYDRMAEQFLDLWQEQMRSSMHQPDFLRSMLDVMQQTGKASHEPAGNATVPPQSRDRELAELERRLALCEARIASLESELHQSRKAAAPKRRKS